MRKIILKKIFSFFMALLILTPLFAFSLPVFALEADPGSSYWGYNGETGADFAESAGLGNTEIRSTITNVIKLLISFLGIIAVIIIILGIVTAATAEGNEEKAEKAKKFIIGGFVGLVIILFSYAIASFVLNFFVSTTSS